MNATSHRLGIIIAFAAVATSLFCVSGCERSTSRDSKEGSATSDSAATSRLSRPQTPTEVVERTRLHRLAGELGLMDKYIIEEQREAVVDLVQSVDQLIAANAVLVSAIRDHIGPGTAEAVDRPGVKNIAGVLSHDVEIISEHIEGDRAIVTVQIAKRVPLEKVELIRREGHWLIKTDAPIRGVARELRNLAEVLADVADGVRDKRYDAGSLLRELKAREAPIGRRLADLNPDAIP